MTIAFISLKKTILDNYKIYRDREGGGVLVLKIIQEMYILARYMRVLANISEEITLRRSPGYEGLRRVSKGKCILPWVRGGWDGAELVTGIGVGGFCWQESRGPFTTLKGPPFTEWRNFRGTTEQRGGSRLPERSHRGKKRERKRLKGTAQGGEVVISCLTFT